MEVVQSEGPAVQTPCAVAACTRAGSALMETVGVSTVTVEIFELTVGLVQLIW